MTGGGPGNSTETAAVLDYKTMMRHLDFGNGSAVAVVVFLCVLAINFLYVRLLGVNLGRSVRSAVTFDRVKSALFYLAVFAMVLFIIFPFLWQIRTSLMPPQEINQMPPLWLPSKPFFGYYESIFFKRSFLGYLKNSAIVASSTTIVAVVVGSCAAYAIARLDFPFKNIILATVLAVSMIALISPVFLILKNLKLLNTYAGLVILYATFAMSLAIWNLTAFFREIPRELEESGKVDGCTPMQVFLRIMVPLAVPGAPYNRDSGLH